MYHHVKKLMYTVRVDDPDPRFGNMLLEQFGGANGELAAAMQYSIQGLNCDDPDRKDLLMDIGTEELSHLEVVGALARLHLKPMKFKRDDAEADPLIAIAGGGGVNLFNSMGNPWTADYLKITGELDVDLRSNIAAEARAKIVYERLINFTTDQGTKDALQFLMTREITHMKAFAAALESMGKGRFQIGQIPPTPGLVDQFFNDSTGRGEDGEVDARGPWNQGDSWQFVEAPAFEEMRAAAPSAEGPEMDNRTTSTTDDPELLQELLVDQLRDLLSAETQLTRAIPKMVERANASGLQICFEEHLAQTEEHVERLKQALEMLDAGAKAKPCKGMAGLLEEGDEVMQEGEQKEPEAADLALIAAAQKVEHYEISSYKTARTLAGQIGRPDIALLMNTTLGEEEAAESLLTQIARELMSESRTGISKDDELTDAETGSAKKTGGKAKASKRAVASERRRRE
jgi:Mn-containing catalase